MAQALGPALDTVIIQQYLTIVESWHTLRMAGISHVMVLRYPVLRVQLMNCVMPSLLLGIGSVKNVEKKVETISLV